MQEAELRVCDLKPQELFNLAWAFTQVRPQAPRRGAALLACGWGMSRWHLALPFLCSLHKPPPGLPFPLDVFPNPSEPASPCVQLGHRPQCLFEAIAREVPPRAFAFSPQELSGVLWALAKGAHSGRGVPALLQASAGAGASCRA